jgi:hypothetical protein
LSPGRTSVAAALDDAAELVVREVPGWAGLLALTALPLRFAEARFVDRLALLGHGAGDHLSHLLALSLLLTLALLPALWGRAVYARACTLALAGRDARAAPARRVLRLPAAGFLAYVYTAAVLELPLLALGWMVVPLPVLVLLLGLAAAVSPLHERPGPIASLAVIGDHLRPFAPLLALSLVFTLLSGIAFLNLFLLFRLGLWLLGGVAGLDLSWWSVALGPDHRMFLLLVLAGAATALEPFWLAALVAAVRNARSRESGEDLAAWFGALGAGAEEAA